MIRKRLLPHPHDDEHQRGNVVVLELTRIVREPLGGWYVITPCGCGWLHSSRREALIDKASIDEQWRGQR
jgi:hypothetical protein